MLWSYAVWAGASGDPRGSLGVTGRTMGHLRWRWRPPDGETGPDQAETPAPGRLLKPGRGLEVVSGS